MADPIRGGRPIAIVLSPDAPPAYQALGSFFEQLVDLADGGRFTGPVTMNWKDGSPTSIKVEAHGGAATKWRFPL